MMSSVDLYTVNCGGDARRGQRWALLVFLHLMDDWPKDLTF